MRRKILKDLSFEPKYGDDNYNSICLKTSYA